MASVIAELCEWARDLPYWEQRAFDKILQGLAIVDADLDELVSYLLEDADLQSRSAARPSLVHIRATNAADATAPAQTRLLKLNNLKNINALVEDQQLTFCSGLTIVYGANGSGKSGYARVLGSAGFTRGDREVLPNVEVPPSVEAPQSADIELDDGMGPRIVTCDIRKPSPVLRAFYVFDSTSVAVHLSSTNAFSFSPAGLSYLTRLADVIDRVRKRLESRGASLRMPHEFTALFPGASAVASLVTDLSADTDVTKLRELASLSPEESQRMRLLQGTIAERKTRDLEGALIALRQMVADIERLNETVAELERTLASDTASRVQTELDLYGTRSSAAQLVTSAQFRTDKVQSVGSDEWHSFVDAAKVLAVLQNRGTTYPSEGDNCLLCQQSLSVEARALLSRLWAFVDSEAQSDLALSEARLNALGNQLRSVKLDFLSKESVAYRHLQTRDTVLLSRLLAFLESCRSRSTALIGAITSRRWQAPPGLGDSISDAMRSFLEELRRDLRSTEDESRQDDTPRLEEELTGLKHRGLLSTHLQRIVAYVEGLAWAERASALPCSTRHVTIKYNEVFARLVTERYLQLFQDTLSTLQRPLHVEVRTSGRKGETFKQIILRTVASGTVATPPAKILSEGEKRAVALADFLTEVTLDTASAGIILDDPVTSLDLEWRSTMARILANEASKRQVIVFTHDLPFVYHLKEAAEGAAVVTETHWIKRGASDDRPGYVFLNNSPALERDYRKPTRARDLYVKAKNAAPSEQESLLREGFGALRTSYEAFIIFELLNEVVMRFDERISFGRLKGIVWDKSISEEVIKKCEALSRYIEGHLHSDTLMAVKPTPQLLFDEIEAFDALVRRLRQLRTREAKDF